MTSKPLDKQARQKSTIVRIIPSWVQALAHAIFGILERVSPGLAGRFALRLWLTPPHLSRARRPPAKSREQLTRPLAATTPWATRPRWGLPPGRRFVVADQIVAETWGSGPVVLLLHGWGGDRTHLSGMIEPLVAAGMQVVALDAPGHGQSGPGKLGGRRTTLTEIASALTAVSAVIGPPYAVIAHSGGCAATGLAVRDGLAAERLVFIAPMADPMAMLGQFSHVLGLGRRSKQRFLRGLEHAAGRDLAEFNLPERAAEADKLPPLLVIHDRDDRQLPHEHGQAVADSWPGARLLSTTGLGHFRLLADPEVIRAAVAFVTDPGA